MLPVVAAAVVVTAAVAADGDYGDDDESYIYPVASRVHLVGDAGL